MPRRIARCYTRTHAHAVPLCVSMGTLLFYYRHADQFLARCNVRMRIGGQRCVPVDFPTRRPDRRADATNKREPRAFADKRRDRILSTKQRMLDHSWRPPSEMRIRPYARVVKARPLRERVEFIFQSRGKDGRGECVIAYSVLNRE
jgi:hypothetical protein